MGLAGIFGYLYNITLANRLSPVEFGTYTALLSIVYWFQVIMTTTQNLLTKIVGHYHDYNLTVFKNWIIKRFGLVALIGIVVVVILHQPIAFMLRITPDQALFLAFPIAMAALGAIAKGFFFGKQKIKTANSLSFLETIPELIGGFFVTSAKQGIALYSLATLVVNTVALPFIKFDTKRPTITPEPIRLRTYLQMLAILLLMNLPFTLDIILVDPALRPEYSALSLLGKGLFFTSTVVCLIMFANLSRRQSEPHRQKILLMSLGFVLLVCSIFIVGYYFNQDALFNLFFSNKYQNIKSLVGLYCIGMTLFAISYVFSNYLVVINFYKQWLGILVVVLLQVVIFSLGLGTVMAVVLVQVGLYAVLAGVLACYTYYAFKIDYGVPAHTRRRSASLPKASHTV